MAASGYFFCWKYFLPLSRYFCLRTFGSRKQPVHARSVRMPRMNQAKRPISLTFLYPFPVFPKAEEWEICDVLQPPNGVPESILPNPLIQPESTARSAQV